MASGPTCLLPLPRPSAWTRRSPRRLTRPPGQETAQDSPVPRALWLRRGRALMPLMFLHVAPYSCSCNISRALCPCATRARAHSLTPSRAAPRARAWGTSAALPGAPLRHSARCGLGTSPGRCFVFLSLVAHGTRPQPRLSRVPWSFIFHLSWRCPCVFLTMPHLLLKFPIELL